MDVSHSVTKCESCGWLSIFYCRNCTQSSFDSILIHI